MQQYSTWSVVSVITSLWLFTSPATSADGPVNIDVIQREMHVSLLLSDLPRDSRLGATMIRKCHASDLSLIDLVAEQLARTIERTIDDRLLVTLRLYVNTLAVDKSGRYRKLLERTRAKVVSDSALVKNINKILGSIGNSATLEFVPGSIDIEERRAVTVPILRPATRTGPSQFDSITRDSTLETVLNKMGMPDFIHARGMHVQLLELGYKNQGVMVFGVTNNTWTVSYTAKEQVLVDRLYTGQNLSLAENLASLKGRDLAYYFKSENKRIYKDIDVMCLLARRIATYPGVPDPYEVVMAEKSLAHIAHTNDPRAVELLKLASRSNSERLVASAKKLTAQHDRLAEQGRLQDVSASTHNDDDSDEMDASQDKDEDQE